MKLALIIDNDCDVQNSNGNNASGNQSGQGQYEKNKQMLSDRYKVNSAFDDSSFFNPIREPYHDFLGISEVNGDQAQADVNADVQKQFPYPVYTCVAAQQMYDGLGEAIKSAQQQMAGNGCSSGCKRVQARYVLGYQQQQDRFNQWISKQNCKQIVIDAKLNKTTNQIIDQTNQTALDAQKQAAAINSTIYYAVGGILVLGVIMIVLKHKKQQA